MRRALLAALLLALAATPLAHAASPSVEAAKAAAIPKALAYLTQESQGGGPVGAYLVEAALGVGLDPGIWPSQANSLLSRLDVPSVGPANTATGHLDPTRPLEAYLQSGYDPTHMGGRDAVADLKAQWPQSNQEVGFAAFTILGLHAAGLPDNDPTIQNAEQTLLSGQTSAGAWVCAAPSGPGEVQNVDCTGMALTALAAVHGLLPSTGALSQKWLDNSRNPDGGYQENPNPAKPASNTQSTIWALNGYRAIGAPEPDASWDYLLSMQADDGSFRVSATVASTPANNLWPTEEILASFTRTFNAWPVYHAAQAVVGSVHADVAAALRLDGTGFSGATWLALDGSGQEAHGLQSSLTFRQPGPALLHVEAAGDGVHARAFVPLQVLNDPPFFVGLADQVADRVHPFAYAPQAQDPEGQGVAVTWSLDGGPAQPAPVAASFHALGAHTLALTATDPHGAQATATVRLTVANLPPVLADLQVPLAATAGASIPFAVQASDPDGPAPTVGWDFGSVQATGTSGQVTLPAGTYAVRVTATDGDGATTSLLQGLTVSPPPSSAPAPAAPAAQPPAAAPAQPQPAASSAPPAATQPSSTQKAPMPAPNAVPPPATVQASPSPVAQPATPQVGTPVLLGRASLALPAVGVVVELAVLLGLLALARRRRA